jgi:hypothetical protein
MSARRILGVGFGEGNREEDLGEEWHQGLGSNEGTRRPTGLFFCQCTEITHACLSEHAHYKKPLNP